MADVVVEFFGSVSSDCRFGIDEVGCTDGNGVGGGGTCAAGEASL